jgi:hypothetical protein
VRDVVLPRRNPPLALLEPVEDQVELGHWSRTLHQEERLSVRGDSAIGEANQAARLRRLLAILERWYRRIALTTIAIGDITDGGPLELLDGLEEGT